MTDTQSARYSHRPAEVAVFVEVAAAATAAYTFAADTDIGVAVAVVGNAGNTDAVYSADYYWCKYKNQLGPVVTNPNY